MTLFEYVEKYGDKSFKELEFNEIDNVILSLVSYIDFTDIVSINRDKITLKEAAEKYFEKYSDEDLRHNIFSIRSSIKLFKKISNYNRYNTLTLHDYKKITNENEQFGAICIDILDDLMYVSFEGTDEAIAGWKEDFMLAYKFPILSQDDAITYLEKIAEDDDTRLIIGGHSKGGNLALISALYSSFWIKNKIIKIYNNDGPGVLKEQIESSYFLKLKDKYVHIVPQNSIVGILLYNDNYQVITSTGIGIFAHDALSWQVEDNKFINNELLNKNKEFRDILIKWLEKYSEKERKKCIDEIFMVFEDNGINSLMDIKKDKLKNLYNIIKSSNQISTDSKKMLNKLIILIFSDYSDIIKKRLGLKK